MRRRRPTILIAALVAAVLCLGSYEVAVATAPKPAAVSATHGIGACATAAGYLRLVDSSARCAGGYSAVSLAQVASAPKAIAIEDTSKTIQYKGVELIGNTTVEGHCAVSKSDQTAEATLYVSHAGPINIDGTTFLTQQAGTAEFDGAGGGYLPAGPSAVDSITGGYFRADASGSNQNYAKLNMHLLITVAGAVYTVTVAMQVIAASYCRVDVEMTQAAT